jgi:hypothetical protein
MSTTPREQESLGDDKDFLVVLTVGGATITTGLYLLFVERRWVWGGPVSGVGLVMLAPLSPFFRQTIARLTGRRALWVVGIANWLFLAANVGLMIYHSYFARPPVAVPVVAASRMSGQCALLMFHELATEVALKNFPPSLVVISGTETDQQLWGDVMMVFSYVSMNNPKLKAVWPPNYDRDQDAPRLEGRKQIGFTIYGRNEIGNFLMQELSYYGVTHQTGEIPSEKLLDYYHTQGSEYDSYKSIAWIDIGPGNPWNPVYKQMCGSAN